MASSQAIISDVDLLYRNTFTIDQKLVWLNEEMRELFDVLEIESEPYAFSTVADNNYYPLPEQFDVTKIKTITMQLNTTSPNHVELPFKRNDNDVYAGYCYWYSIVSDMLYIYYQGGVPDGMNVYIFCDAEPIQVTNGNITSEPSLPTKYQELLKLGILKRIAMARKDLVMHDNYDAEYQEKIADVVWLRHTKEPEFVQPTSNMPQRNHWQYRYIVNGW